jgi:hypothetical protein
VLAPATTAGSGVHTEERVRAVGCLVIVGRGWESGKVVVSTGFSVSGVVGVGCWGGGGGSLGRLEEGDDGWWSRRRWKEDGRETCR